MINSRLKLEGFVSGMLSINYEALFELNTDAMIVVNQAGVVIQANSAFYVLSQFKYEDLRNRRYETFFQYVHEQCEITERDERTQLICKDGMVVPILVRKIVQDTYFFIVMKDMRALDAVAENYLTSQLHYRTIAENIQDVLILMDEQKNYLYVSPSAKQMFQFDYRQLDNRSAFFNIHPDHVALLETSFEQAMVEGTSFTVKVKAWHEEQQWMWTEINGQPMFEDGKFKHMLFVARDISVQKEYEDTLIYDAYFDVLTNLPNRRKLNELLVEAKLGLKEQQYFAVMLMDIDNFKYINDYYGHEIGDYVLIEFGKRVSAVLDGIGLMGRYGGDEFIVLMPYQIQQQVEYVASSIVSEMQRPIEIQHTKISISTSIGIALVEEDVAVRNMLKCADDALYRVKEKGKDAFDIARVMGMPSRIS